ncbi:glycosyltransferase family 4 protein [Cellulomonas chengniuliangii]|uniref:Glycosyltransferase family 4 protein n=1 Tax=Cellulomonas chengniuliangii TaxID=2968084 RepID=A0ABY5KZ69_9CELL|nr:glycosyltransferase family 1 protein [Cellulomonas chengniuliangii]MCC2310079.1 glycosyltransferase family 4 protein [Cellulomonas chengniuliangii]UUI74526.1 glycosyltransferase family 4 protein [Cellulomonas chengniuliangii]
MRITLDATPLLGARTGVGQYVQHLVAELPAAIARRDLDAEVRATTWTARGSRLTDLPQEVAQVGPRVPARLLRELWRRGDHPRIETLVGRTEVFHGTNFTSPPTHRAREVVTIHDLTYVLHRSTVSSASVLYQELVPRALARGAHVVTPSHAVAAEVAAFYDLDTSRVTATPLGVELDWFDATPASPAWLSTHGLPTDYLVFVGSLDPRKNLPTLLAAHSQLRAEHPDTPALVLAGPAGREASLANRAGLHLTGWLSTPDLQALVAGARALVLPSIDEGFGLPVIEALATGRPVVTSDIPALREVGGPHAVVADALDPASLATALSDALQLADGPVDRARRREWARRFSWSAFADRTLDAYLAS